MLNNDNSNAPSQTQQGPLPPISAPPSSPQLMNLDNKEPVGADK